MKRGLSKKEKKKKFSSVKKVIFAISIALITVFFVVYAIQSIYPSPKWDRYCDPTKPFDISTQKSCEASGGIWTVSEPGAQLILTCTQKNKTNQYECGPAADYQKYIGYCNIGEQACEREYRDAREPYELRVFILNLMIGLAVFIFAFFLSVEALSTGFIGGGAILMIYGTIRYWGELSDVWRTIFLGIALSVLVYFGYKKLKN